ncbi:MAG: FKBP-type peptidyl-prolyl cis-trans isomerase [Bacteroidales bacterium]|nr:FKBP-type peptidyl-prolyl cis-trans isomerase [Bacteroidales bacterium]
MKKFFLLAFIFGFLVSCNNGSRYPGFSKSRKGFYYQLHSIGEGETTIKTGDYVTADIAYLTMSDSIFFEGRRKIKLEKPAFRGAIEDCFAMLNDDESATFILEAGSFFNITLESDLPSFLKDGDKLKIRISVIDVQTEQQYNNEKQAFLKWINDFGEYEKVILQQFLNEEDIDIKPYPSGLIYIPVKTGNNIKIEPGDTITINYEGRFLNGKFFDSTVRRNQPFQFVYGTEWQVIKGLEEGIRDMSEGEKAIFITPSELAFGQSGSSTGIIPPFTSLIFELEVLSVKKGPQQNKL